MEDYNFKEKNYVYECVTGIITAFLGSILCTIGFGIGQNLEERQWIGKFDWYGFLCTLVGGAFGQSLQLVIIFEILGI